MVLIISSDNDITTNEVIDWLLHFNVKFFRINSTTKILVKNITIKSKEIDFELEIFLIDGSVEIIKYSKITSIWYRRGRLNIWRGTFFDSRINMDKNTTVNNYLLREQFQVEHFINYMFSKKRHLNSIFDEPNTNKLKNLVLATECGLETPNTFITSSKKELFNNKEVIVGKSITKPIKFGNIEIENGAIGAGTVIFDLKQEFVADIFFPSLFQEKIEKKWEIRTFYFNRKTYSIAIFSQNNEKTATDFRNYDTEKPNRITPFLLPIEIEEKLILFMEKVGLNCGSIDFIYTTENQFLFLEVNPVGQFNQVSLPANYYLEKKIAKFLIDEE